MATLNPAVTRRARLLPRIHRPRFTPLRALALFVVAVILFAAWMWFRSSSLVSVRQVQVTGLSGANAGEIRSTLTSAAEGMTTLTVSTRKLESSVSGYGHIARVSVSTHFPHGVTIHVDETIPVATISSGGRQVAVDGAGRLLPGQSTHNLPALPVAPSATDDRVSATSTRAVLSVLEAAPYQLLPYLKSARMTAGHGVTVTLRNGPIIYFGATSQLSLKWQAADATLASANSAGASYINVTAPRRPAAGS